ncbi:MAG: Gfo/Idh/MocA family oxidoreductase [Gemmatimonadetes bacterium]|nr:Gfo/Idh/MocA family oxidoreductase [Gemmatimonadota bacterium]
MRQIRVGVLGVGSLGFHHARHLRDLDGFVLTGVFDLRRERAAEVAAQFGVRAAPTQAALLEDIDAAIVAVPTAAHEDVATAALEGGVHTFIEKPIADSLEAADRILDVAQRTGLLLQIGHVERFNPAVLAAEPYLDEVLFVESDRLAPFGPRGTDVAVVLDLMIHDVDLVLSLVGRPVREIAAVGVPVLTPSVDIANARLAFEGGAVANLTASRVSMERIRKLRIFQRSGYLSLNLAEGTGEFLRLRDVPGTSGRPGVAPALEDIVEHTVLRGPENDPLRSELENFRDAILGGIPPAVSGADGRGALAVAVAIIERIEGHVVATLPAS